MTETVIITGQQLTIDHQADDRPNPKRKRPPEYVPPTPTDVDLLATIRLLGQRNPHWSDEANAWAEAHPEVRPKDAAKRWRKHRIEVNHA